MLSCKEITEQASQYHDKDMGTWQRMQFRMHLMMCKHCRRFMDQFETTVNSISQFTPVEPDPQAIEDQVQRLLQASRKK